MRPASQRFAKLVTVETTAAAGGDDEKIQEPPYRKFWQRPRPSDGAGFPAQQPIERMPEAGANALRIGSERRDGENDPQRPEQRGP
jgi:hypothetical protein